MSDIRMIQLLPEQVSSYWPILRPVIEMALPPVSKGSGTRMANVLTAILGGKLDVHTFCSMKPDGAVKVLVVMTSAKVSNFDSDQDNLLVYTMSAIDGISTISPYDWNMGFDLLKRYAKGRGCQRILAYSNETGVLALVKRAGGNSDFRLLVMDLD